MNNYVITEIDSAQKKMSAYVTLLNYRYMNLCVKAEVGALMPVTVYIGEDAYNIEDVATVNCPDDFHFGVYPKNENNLQDIIQGIYEAHPEFKMETASIDGSGESDKRYLLYTMPDVDDNRHDFLENAVKGLHDECCARIEAIHLEFKERMVENMAKISQAETDEAVEALDDLRQKSLELANNQLEKKEQEIDEGYERYLEEKERKDSDEFDYTKGFRMFSEE